MTTSAPSRLNWTPLVRAVIVWPEIERLASRFAERTPEQSQLGF